MHKTGYIIPMTQNVFLEQPSLLLPPQNVLNHLSNCVPWENLS